MYHRLLPNRFHTKQSPVNKTTDRLLHIFVVEPDLAMKLLPWSYERSNMVQMLKVKGKFKTRELQVSSLPLL